MMTFKDIQDHIEFILNDTSISTNIQTMINDYWKEVIYRTGFKFTETTGTATSVASTASYSLPIDYRQMISVKLTVSSIDYFPRPVANEDQWNLLVGGDNSTSESDFPEYYFIDGGNVSFFPTLASAGNTITYKYFSKSRELLSTDFTDNTTGTCAITNGAAAVTGSGTTFLSTDAGRWIRFDEDGFWYRVSAFTDATNITIDRNYEGTTLTAYNFKIGTLPFGFSGNIPVELGAKCISYGVLSELWEKREEFSGSGGKAFYYLKKYEDALTLFKQQMAKIYDSPTVHNPLHRRRVENPNLFPQNLTD